MSKPSTSPHIRAETRPPKPPPLAQFYVYVTDLCNCSCKHCWIVSKSNLTKGRARHFLSPDILELAIREAKPLGLKRVKWTGGEPTIHPYFKDLLAIQKRHRLLGTVETNGMEVTPELAGLLSKSGVRHVSVSLDGASPSTHDAIRGVGGAYRRALRGFANLREVGYRPQIIMTLMRENAGELEDMLALAEALGAGSVKFNITQPTLKGLQLHRSGQALSVKELLEINKRLNQQLKPKHKVRIFLDIPMAFRPIKSLVDGDECCVCGIFTILGLMADGRYALCGIGVNVPELVFGRVGKDDLKALWREHPVLVQLREGLPARLTGVCGRCLMKGACLGACVAQNYYRSHDLLAPFWFCDLAEAQGLFPATRLRP